MKRGRIPWLRVRVSLLVGGAILAACAPGRHYKVLSFFFDGVPDPNAPTTSTQATSRKRPFQLPHRPARPITVPAALPYVSQHKPFAERQCNGCHDLASGRDALTRAETLCDKCHQELRIREQWSHGPINLGMCTPCHRAHESPYPHLLEEPMPNLCLRCHEDVMDHVPNYHQVPNLGECTRCHDPHRASTEKAKTS